MDLGLSGIKTDREIEGLVTEWYKNGQKKFERNYKDGKEVSKEMFY